MSQDFPYYQVEVSSSDEDDPPPDMELEESVGEDDSVMDVEEVGEEEQSDAEITREDYGHKKKISPVWKHAEKVADGAVCNLCGKVVPSKFGNTSNLKHHILTKHKDSEAAKELSKDIEEKKAAEKIKNRKKDAERKMKGSMLQFVNRKCPIGSQKKAKIDNALVEFVVMENQSFAKVDKSPLRRLLFTACPDYVAPSSSRLKEMINNKSESCELELKLEIIRDIVEAGHMTVSITFDGGTSKDKMKTKKHAITLHRTTKDFEIKSDTIGLVKCVGSQPADVVRMTVKTTLQRFGHEPNWKVNVTTDGEPTMVAARRPGGYPAVGLNTNLVGTCIDHTIHLVVEESLENVRDLADAIKKVRQFVEYLVQSSPARQALLELMAELGIPVLAPMQGTSNRWFYKWSEVRRILELRPAMEIFFDRFELPDRIDRFDSDEWALLHGYVRALEFIVVGSKMMEGEKYPAATAAIPFIDQVMTDLDQQERESRGDLKKFVSNLKHNMKRRFPDGYKKLRPYNCLTFVNPSYRDMYCDTEELKEQLLEDLKIDACFDEVQGQVEEGGVEVRDVCVAAPEQTQTALTQSARRAELLARRHNNVPEQRPSVVDFTTKLKLEVEKYSSELPCALDVSPCDWWKEKQNKERFPLLATYFNANSSFQATSCASERVYNIDGLVMMKQRKNMTTDMHGKLVILQDYLKKRINTEEFRLCPKCPQPPSLQSCYKVCCMKHNKI